MRSYNEIVKSLVAPAPHVAFEVFTKNPKAGKPPMRLFVREGVKPVDLYCYLYARFGRPNGMLSVLRKNDSDNFFHWHYTLYSGDHRIEIMAGTYKIELWYPEELCSCKEPEKSFVQAIKEDFS